ncbi:MAG TPA: TraB/GumN family protein [Caulobacteraceae bacterium]|jgi:hypothetical protein
MPALSRFAALALAALVCVGWAAPAAAQPPVWVVRSKTTTLVLFGSIHLLPPGLDWRPAALDDALAHAGELWFELPIDAVSDNLAAHTAQTRGSLPQGRRLADLLSADEQAKLAQAAAQLHCDPTALDRMWPWMADFTLSVAEDSGGGADASNGVEEQIQAITPLTVRRMGFENARQQIGFLAGAPVKDQIASLDWTLHEVDDDPASYKRVVDEWMAGDMTALQADAVAQLKTIAPTLYDRLLVDRNRRWAATLASRLRYPGEVVVIVGVGHLIGPDGLPALLRAQGYEVDGP